MRFLPILGALLLITGPGLATAGPDATGSPSAAPAPVPTSPTESVPAIPPAIIRLPAPARLPANILPPALPAGTAQAGQQADLTGDPAQARTLTTAEASDSLQPSLETVLQAIRGLEKRLDALETAIRQLSAQTMAPELLQSHKADPKATSNPPAPADTVYVVQPGDTLNSLAARFSVERWRLIELNRLNTPDLLPVGQQLRIPAEGSPRGVVMSPFREAQ